MSTSDVRVITPVAINDTTLTSTTVAEDEYSAYDAGTTYAIGDYVIDAHKVYVSSQNSNTGNTPADSPTFWDYVSPSNAWAMFDSSNSSTVTQTVSSSIVVELEPGVVVDSVWLGGLVATSVQVQMLDEPGGTEVYNQTTTLSSGTVAEWVGVFADPTYVKTEALFSSLPAYATGVITVTISGTNVACGTLVMGASDTLGSLQVSPTAGIRDFSKVTTDDFGERTFTRRGFSKRTEFKMLIDNSRLPKVFQLLAGLRATPAVYLGTEMPTMDPLRLLGYFSDFNVEVPFQQYSYCTMQVEGL